MSIKHYICNPQEQYLQKEAVHNVELEFELLNLLLKSQLRLIEHVFLRGCIHFDHFYSTNQALRYMILKTKSPF
jgi:hypothetical protein